MSPFAIVSFKWRGLINYRSQYSAAHVNVHKRMFDRHLRMRFEYVCVTDDPSGLDPDIRVVPLWDDHAKVPSPHGPSEPSCFRRLRLFARDAAEVIGARRFAMVDLDVVLTSDVTPLFSRTEPIVLLPTPNEKIPFNGSLILMDAGARPDVWESFDPISSPKRNRESNCLGSDQGQISYCLRDKGEATWKVGPGGDGIYFAHRHLGYSKALPRDARMVSFHGRGDPWSPHLRDITWIREHYR